jgi:hypothetical protein
MRTCSAMPLSAHMLLPNEEFNSGTETAGLNRRHAPDSSSVLLIAFLLLFRS